MRAAVLEVLWVAMSEEGDVASEVLWVAVSEVLWVAVSEEGERRRRRSSGQSSIQASGCRSGC